MSYPKIGKFKPGDIIIPKRLRSHPTTVLKIIGIKYRRKKFHSLYQLRFADDKTKNFSRYIRAIDESYQISLSTKLKNL